MTESMSRIHELITVFNNEMKKQMSQMAVYEKLDKQYSVTLKKHDSSADDNKVEHSINQEQMMSQIESIALDLGNSITNYYTDRFVSGTRIELPVQNCLAFEHFQQELKDCFAMHFKVDSKSSSGSVEQLHSDEELMSKIECIALELADNFAEGNQYVAIEESDFFQKWTKKQFAKVLKTHRNTVSTAVKQKDDNLVDEDELTEQIETLLFSLSTTMIDDYYGNEVIAISGKNNVAKEIAKLFKTYQNSILRPVKD